jgi:RNA polymerase sigma-70 factor (ECF subfamily)
MPSIEHEKPANEMLSEDPRDKAMIEAFIAGDMAGFKYVYSKYRQRVFSYCLYYMSNEMLAEDAFQEVFSRAYTRRDQLRETKALKSWLLLITRSVCLNMLRTSKFTPEFVSISSQTSTSDDSDVRREPKELSVQPNEQLLADDMLQQALAKLAPMYRDAFLLREFEGYEYEEIAEMTGASLMNVKVRITRAKKRLRILLAPYYSNQASARPAKKAKDKNAEEKDETFNGDEFSTGRSSVEALVV